MAESRTGPDDTRKPFEEKYFDCAATGKLEEVKYLLKATVHVDLRNEKGWTALMLASRNGHLDIVNTLLEKGCDVNLVNKTGQTAQDIALFWDQSDIANVLMEHVKTINPDKQLRNFFSLNLLNRCAEKRKDIEWLTSAMRNPDTKYIVFNNLRPLLEPISIKNSRWGYTLARIDSKDVQNHLQSNPHVVFLGLEKFSGETKKSTENEEEGRALFAVDVSSIEESVYKEMVPKSEFAAGFPLAMQLEPSEAGILSEARTVLDWLERYKFCATCGSATTVLEGGYKRKCENKECKSNKGVHNTCYPRTDPSVIMLVISQDGKRCLLGRQKRFPAKMWSCLAGFIEPGESIEDACRREVEEESGIKVGRVTYHSSQPWPFPASLMLGCIAYATSDTVKVDEDEMEDARWFRRPEVVQMLTHQHPQGLYVPPEQAIAHQIIKSWVRMTANL